MGTEEGGLISWTGPINVGSPVAITYGVTVTSSFAGFTVTNRADVHDDYGNPLELTAYTLVPFYRYIFPIIFRDF